MNDKQSKAIAEKLNGRLAIMGFHAAVVNYGFTGWKIPRIFKDENQNTIHKYKKVQTNFNDSYNRIRWQTKCLSN